MPGGRRTRRAPEDDSDRGDTTHKTPHHPGANRGSGVRRLELEVHIGARQETGAALDKSAATRQVQNPHDNAGPNATSHRVRGVDEADPSKLPSFRSLGHGEDHCPVAL